MVRIISIDSIFPMRKEKVTLINTDSDINFTFDIDPFSRIIISANVGVSDSGRSIAQVKRVNTRLLEAKNRLSKAGDGTLKPSKRHPQRIISSPNVVKREALILSRTYLPTNQFWQKQNRSSTYSLRTNTRCRVYRTGGARCLK